MFERRVEFCDTDMAGIVHFTAFFRYMEAAEHELLRSVGLSPFERGEHDFPRKHVEAAFHRVLPLDAPFVMRVTVGKIGTASIRYDYRVFSDEACTELAIDGSMTVVSVKDGKPAPVPSRVRAALS